MESKELDESNASTTTTPITDTLVVQENSPSKTLFSLLEDKNHLIKSLQKQLENQKVQIKFYIQKHLNNPKMIEFSRSCSPEIVEENIPLALAMGNFRKRFGIKSKICQLHQQMNEIYRISTNNLDNQEYVLKEFFSHLCSLYPNRSSNSTISVDSTHLLSVLNDPRQIILMNNVLDSTIDLKRILEHFKVTCERLINIEDERNDIVHQTLALSTNEQLSFKMAINTNIENKKLKKEIEKIKEKNPHSETHQNDFASIEKQLSDLQNQFETLFSTDDTSKIYNMLDNLNDEARGLLSSTKNLTENEDNKHSDISAARNFFKKISSDQEKHTIRVEYAQKEVKETKSIFHAKFYNTTESDNEVKFHSKEKHKTFTNENDFEKDTWKEQIFANIETFSKNDKILAKDYHDLVQQIKTKDEHILNLKNLSKNLNDKINFMQIIIDKQTEQLQQQQTLTRFLIQIFEGRDHFKSENQVCEKVQYLCQNIKQTEESNLGETHLNGLKNNSVSDSNISSIFNQSSIKDNFFGIQNKFPKQAKESKKFYKIPPALGVFSENRPKFRLLTKTVELPFECRKSALKSIQITEFQSENWLEECELFKDVSDENIPTICKPIDKNAAIFNKQSKDNKNLVEAEKWKRGEHIENKVDTNALLTESYCIPFEKI